MSNLTLGVVLLPDEATESYVIGVSKMLGPTNKIKYGPPPYVHLSLLHTMIRQDSLVRVQQMVAEIPLPKSISFECDGLLFQRNGWCFLEVQKTRQLLDLQTAVLPVAKMRVAGIPFGWRNYATEAQKKAHHRYGYPNVGEAWPTHFTLGFTEPGEKDEKTVYYRQGEFQRLALAIMGDCGKAEEILYERPF